MYSEKQIQIFEGVLGLAASGQDLRRINVQSIATAAGVGKGTLYEYFSTKEEILLTTLAHSLEQEMIAADEILSGAASFAGKIDAMYGYISKVKRAKGNIYRLLLDGLSGQAISCADFAKPIQQQLQIGRRKMDAFIESGKQEGAIALQHSNEYCYFVLSSVIVGMLKPTADEQEAAKKGEFARQMILKALG